MTEKEFFAVLELPENASRDEIQRRYSELYNRLQVQITHAPDENLRLKDQDQLTRLKEAFNRISGNNTKSQLPAVNPVTAPMHTAQLADTAQTDLPLPQAYPDISKKSAARFKIAFLWALFATVAAVLFGLLFARNSGHSHNTQAGALETVFQNRPFKIKNVGRLDIYVTYCKLWYLQDTVLAEYTAVDAGLDPDQIISIKSNSSYANFKKKNVYKTIFDGNAVFYHIVVQDTDDRHFPKPLAGRVPKEEIEIGDLQ